MADHIALHTRTPSLSTLGLLVGLGCYGITCCYFASHSPGSSIGRGVAGLWVVPVAISAWFDSAAKGPRAVTLILYTFAVTLIVTGTAGVFYDTYTLAKAHSHVLFSEQLFWHLPMVFMVELLSQLFFSRSRKLSNAPLATTTLTGKCSSLFFFYMLVFWFVMTLGIPKAYYKIQRQYDRGRGTYLANLYCNRFGAQLQPTDEHEIDLPGVRISYFFDPKTGVELEANPSLPWEFKAGYNARMREFIELHGASQTVKPPSVEHIASVIFSEEWKHNDSNESYYQTQGEWGYLRFGRLISVYHSDGRKVAAITIE